IGRARFAASELLVSVFGLPVAGSFGSFKPTMFPHSAPPQLTMATLARPFSVSQFPRGSPAEPGVAATRPRMANAALAKILFMSVPLPFEKPPESTLSPGQMLPIRLCRKVPALTTLQGHQSAVEDVA